METLVRNLIPALKRKYQTQCFPTLQKVLIQLPFVFIIPKILFLTEVSCLELVLNTDSNKKNIIIQPMLLAATEFSWNTN
jgi:hypothetical protein